MDVHQFTYQLGTLLWAKVGNHPYWPCMVSYDPKNGKYFQPRKVGSKVIMDYHVQYFGKLTQHGWTTSPKVMTFEGKEKFFAQRDALKNSSTSNSKKNLKIKYGVPNAVEKKWLNAVKEAEYASLYRPDIRYESFVFKYVLDFKKPINGIKKRRKRKKVLPKNHEALLTQATDMIEFLCGICEKGTVDIKCNGPCLSWYHKSCLGLLCSPENFRCHNCSNGTRMCFICKISSVEVHPCTKCKVQFHPYCLKKFNCADVAKHICSYHKCLTCSLKNLRTSSSALLGIAIQCIRCPTSFHNSVRCIPAGSVKINPVLMICPAHFRGRNYKASQTAINLAFCSKCYSGGGVVVCESCPDARHSRCIVGVVPSGDYHCPNCENRRFFYVGSLIWARAGNFRWWPARVVDPETVPEFVKSKTKYNGEFPVQFYGTDEYLWMSYGRTLPYGQHRYLKGKCPATSSLDDKFRIGIEEAEEIYNEYTSSQQTVNLNTREPYMHIRVNRYIPPAVLYHDSKTDACDCDPSQSEPCGDNSSCVNRALLVECDPSKCKAKENCQNQRIQKRENAEVKVIKTEKCGWGLKTKTFIQMGSFIIEYVGEVISQHEYEIRAAQMLKDNCQNYYFLSLGKGRLIDAGPKGNYARFINHSCNPNCVVEKWSVKGDIRMGIFALRDIQQGEELTFDYNYDGSEFQQNCCCGASNCRKLIWQKEKNTKKKRLRM